MNGSWPRGSAGVSPAILLALDGDKKNRRRDAGATKTFASGR